MSLSTKEDFLCIVESWISIEDQEDVVFGIQSGIITEEEVIARFIVMLHVYCDLYKGMKNG